MLRGVASARLGDGFAVATQDVDAVSAAGGPMDLPSSLVAASPLRRATFRAGRECAHTALRRLGSSPKAVPIGASGAPVWPDGFTGSISHTDRVAAAIVAPSPPVRGLGLDVESAAPLEDAEMVRLVCRPEERVSGRELADPASLLRGKLFFVVKEAVYKLHSPLGGKFLDFHDVRVSVHPSIGRFSAEILDPNHQGTAGRVLTGAFACAEGLIVALATS